MKKYARTVVKIKTNIFYFYLLDATAEKIS
jgi:hypothetical protein